MAQQCLTTGCKVFFIPISVPEPYLKVMRDVAAQNKLPIVEFSETLKTYKGKEKLFQDACHPTIRCYEIIAEDLYKFVSRISDPQKSEP